MQMHIVSTCGVCGVKGTRMFGFYFPGYQMPDPQRLRAYLPENWQVIDGIFLCPLHSYHIVIEQIAQPARPGIEVVREPGARPQPFVWWKEE